MTDDDAPPGGDIELKVTFLDPQHTLHLNDFRHKISHCASDQAKYEFCVQTRDELLRKHAGIQILIDAYEAAMFDLCDIYKKWKQKEWQQPNPLKRSTSDMHREEWARFLGIVESGRRVKHKCLSALTTVARIWGKDVVEHYQWAMKGISFCTQLRGAARAIPKWEEAARGLNVLMLQRATQGLQLKQRPISSSSPVERGDLAKLRRTEPDDLAKLCRTPLPQDNIPEGFGYDKFGLLVNKEYAVPHRTAGDLTTPSDNLPSSDNAGRPSSPPRPAGDLTTLPRSDNLPSSDNAGRPNSPHRPTAPHPNKPGDLTTAPDSTTLAPSQAPDTAPPSTRSLRPRVQQSYQGLASTAGPKPKHTPNRSPKVHQEPQRSARRNEAPVEDPGILQPCCPKVPSLLLSTLESSIFDGRTAKQLSSFVKELCRNHLELWCTRISDIAFTDISASDVTEPLSKRPRLSTPLTATLPLENRPHHELDDEYIAQVLSELSQVTPPSGSHGEGTNQLVGQLLTKVERPNTDSNRGVVEAWFCTGEEAAHLVESLSPIGAPIVTQDQQPFKWGGNGRPIEQFLRRMYNPDQYVAVQTPSQPEKEESFLVRTIGEVRDRFLRQEDPSDPWNILDLQCPVQSILPNFLTGENCELLLHVRNTVLMGNCAERVAAPPQKWNEFKDVREWALLSEGGHHTAPHMDSHGYGTFITLQEGKIGFGWMSYPTEEEEAAWKAKPNSYTGGKWRYIILKPGQTVFFGPGTIHFVFRVRNCQTLAFGGHVLQWSGIRRWIQIVLAELENSAITNEGMRTARKLVGVVAKLVKAKMEMAGAGPLGGEDSVAGFFAVRTPQYCRKGGTDDF